MYKTASCLVNDFYTNVIKLQDHCNGFKKMLCYINLFLAFLKRYQIILKKKGDRMTEKNNKRDGNIDTSLKLVYLMSNA